MNLSKKHKTPKLTFYHLERDNIDETFFDSKQFAWAEIIEAEWKVIRDELFIHLQQNENKFGTYFSNELVNSPGKWRSFGFYFWGIKLTNKACLPFSKTLKILKGIPDVVSASVSIMEADSEIKPHFGDTDAIYRCHLPLLVPGCLPKIGFQVGYEQKNWEEGKLLIFNDAAYHKGWNYTDRKRVILIFDVIRPSLKDKKKWICSQALANITLQYLFNKISFTKKLPMSFIKGIHKIISIHRYLRFSFIKNKFI